MAGKADVGLAGLSTLSKGKLREPAAKNLVNYNPLYLSLIVMIQNIPQVSPIIAVSWMSVSDRNKLWEDLGVIPNINLKSQEYPHISLLYLNERLDLSFT